MSTASEAAAYGATIATGPPRLPDKHFACPICHPKTEPGIKAICGHELRGVKAPEEAPECQACRDALDDHFKGHDESNS